jgi:transcriptional regulator with XRE-family HTH domain
MLEKFAEELRTAREKSGITLQQIAQKSRIDLKYIQAIDKGDFSFLPEVYVKAFIKQFAKIVGLDEHVAIKKFEAAKTGKIHEEEIKPEKTEDIQKEEVSEKAADNKKSGTPKIQQPLKSFQESSGKKTGTEEVSFSERIKSDKAILAGVIGGALAIILVVVYFFFIMPESDIIVAEKPYDEVRKENQQRYVPETPQLNNASSVAPSDSITLNIHASDTTWIRLKIDGREVQEFKLYPNSNKLLKAAVNVSMIVGNAGGTELKLGDKKLNFTGKNKEVRYVLIDKNGLKYIHTPPTF